MQRLFAIFLPIAVAAAAWALDLTRSAGAHPWWSGTAVLIGAPVGFALGIALVLLGNSRRLAVLAGLAAAAAFGVASFGKARFAASFAEDALAGQLWYFGWIAVCALVVATLLAALWPRPSSR